MLLPVKSLYLYFPTHYDMPIKIFACFLCISCIHECNKPKTSDLLKVVDCMTLVSSTFFIASDLYCLLS
ncbi:unnamed protein product [Schistosoma curassoni]|uniref:Ovule protein n=1 Tax=Schistosoma curassoni TaxID=6186 RepID=A0A183K4L8_9TREM|nr:unnamed protein product [Schistosoma curassoni]